MMAGQFTNRCAPPPMGCGKEFDPATCSSKEFQTFLRTKLCKHCQEQWEYNWSQEKQVKHLENYVSKP